MSEDKKYPFESTDNSTVVGLTPISGFIQSYELELYGKRKAAVKRVIGFVPNHESRGSNEKTKEGAEVFKTKTYVAWAYAECSEINSLGILEGHKLKRGDWVHMLCRAVPWANFEKKTMGIRYEFAELVEVRRRAADFDYAALVAAAAGDTDDESDSEIED
jgi:hypothetical protein